MLNLFQYINNILFSKKKNLSSRENCSETLSGFMLNRWCSFYDKQNVAIINDACNKPHLTEDPDLLTKFLMLFIPKKDYKKLNYIKKIKSDKDESKQIISKIMQIGTRDAEIILKTTDKKDLKEFLKIYEHA